MKKQIRLVKAFRRGEEVFFSRDAAMRGIYNMRMYHGPPLEEILVAIEDGESFHESKHFIVGTLTEIRHQNIKD